MEFISAGRTIYFAFFLFRNRRWSFRFLCLFRFSHFFCHIWIQIWIHYFFLPVHVYFLNIAFCFQMLRYKSLMTRIPLFNYSPDNRFRLFSLSIRLCLFRQYIRYRCQSRFSCTTHLVHYRTLQQPQANRRYSHQHNCRSRHRPTTEHDLFLLPYRHGWGGRQYLLQPFPASIRQRFGIIIQPLLYLFQP